MSMILDDQHPRKGKVRRRACGPSTIECSGTADLNKGAGAPIRQGGNKEAGPHKKPNYRDFEGRSRSRDNKASKVRLRGNDRERFSSSLVAESTNLFILKTRPENRGGEGTRVRNADPVGVGEFKNFARSKARIQDQIRFRGGESESLNGRGASQEERKYP